MEFEVTGLGSVCDSFGIVRSESVRRPSRDSRERARYRDKLREGSIARYWRTWHDANADTAMIAKGNSFYMDTGRRYFDPRGHRSGAY